MLSVCLCSPINFRMPEAMFMKLGMCITATELISKAYFINPSHQAVCLFMYNVARQLLGRGVTAVTNTHAIIVELLDASFCMRFVSC
jgi:hypothetical protein